MIREPDYIGKNIASTTITVDSMTEADKRGFGAPEFDDSKRTYYILPNVPVVLKVYDNIYLVSIKPKNVVEMHQSAENNIFFFIDSSHRERLLYDK